MSKREDELLELGIEKGRLLEQLKRVEERIEEIRTELERKPLSSRIREVMSKEPARNFTTSEVASAVTADAEVVRVALARLVDAGRIERVADGVFKATDKINARFVVGPIRARHKLRRGEKREKWEP